jgi:PAS domain S-box-containing protein
MLKNHRKIIKNINSSDQIQSIFDSSPFGVHIYELNKNGELIFKDYNTSADKILRIDHSQRINKKIIEAFPNLIETDIPNKYKQIALGERKSQKELIEYEDDNIKGIYEITPIQISQGKMAVFFYDLTDIKEAEKALIESEERFRTLVNSMLESALIIDFKGKINFANLSAAKLVELESPKDALGRNVLEFLHSEFEEKVKKLLSESEIIPDAIIEELKIITVNKHIKWVEIFGSRISYNNITNILITFRDVTQRKIIDEQIELLTHALHSAANGVVITNKDGEIIWVNSAVTKLIGYTEEELIGKNPSILNSGKMDESFYKNMWQEILSGKVWHGELINKRKDGSLYVEEMTITPVLSGEKGITHFIAIKQDVTQRISGENELREAKEVAEQSSKLKSTFLANMSHELRTPLVGILGFSELLMEELKDNSQNEMAERINSSGKRLMETLNSILDLSRIEANKLEMNKSNCNINSIIKQQVALFEGFATKKKIFLKCELPKSELFAYLDEQILRQILDNLINNAIKYTPSGGVTVSCTQETRKEISYVKIVVKDTGIGIPKESLDLIFQEFRQVSEGFNRQFEGTGLGLTLTKKFINLLNGMITVESEENKGSRFTLLFPQLLSSTEIKTDRISNLEILNDSVLIHKNHLPKILLVENDQYSQDITKMFLKEICITESASSGEEAIKMSEENEYKIILMDINLGTGISGIETTKLLRSSEKYKKTPIVALTAFAMQGDKEEFINSGCNDYLSKPFTKNNLRNVVSKFLESK